MGLRWESLGSFAPLDEVDEAAEMAPGVMQLPGTADAPPPWSPPERPLALGTSDMLSGAIVGTPPAEDPGLREGGVEEAKLAAAGAGGEAKVEPDGFAACDVPRAFGSAFGWRWAVVGSGGWATAAGG